MPPSSLPVRRAPVRLLIAVGLAVLLLVALASRGARTEPDGAPPPPTTSHPTATTAAYTGPTSPPLTTVLAAAAERYGAAIRATIAAAGAAVPHPSPRARAHPSPVATADTSTGDRFDRLASCESGDGHGTINPAAVSPTGRYRGAFQFSLASWAAAGETGDPADHDYPTQKAAAIRWAAMTRPAGQWPVCWSRTA